MMKKTNKYKYLLKNTFLLSISSFGTKILTFFLVPLYTNILSVEDYGNADLIITTSGLLVYVVTICVYEAVLRFSIERSEQREAILGNGLLITIKGSLILAVLLIILSIIDLVNWPEYFYLILFLKVTFEGLYCTVLNYLRAIDKMKQVATAGIIITITTIVSNILFLLILRIGLFGYLLSICLSPLVALIYGVLHCGNIKYIFDSALNSKSKKAEMIKYSFPLLFNSIAWWMNAGIDKYFIVALCGTAVNGIYAVSQKIPTILSVVASIFAQAWNLSAIKEFDKDDTDGFFAKTYSLFNAGLVIICSILILMNVILAKILFAKVFFSAWQYSSWLLISTLFSSTSSFLGSIFSANKDSKTISISTIIAAAMNILFNFLLIPWIGALGAAIATVISFFSVWFIRLLLTRKYINWKLNLITDFIAYMLLIMQVVLERAKNHNYVFQILITVSIIFLYRKLIVDIFTRSLQLLKEIC